MDLEIIQQKNEKHSGSFIFLHGKERNGKIQKEAFLDYLGDKAQFNHIKVIFPTSPVKKMSDGKFLVFTGKYTPSKIESETTNGWFDEEMYRTDLNQVLSDINEASKIVQSIVREEQKNGIPLHRIVIGGISQGGHLAIHSTYSFIPDVAACVALSTICMEKNFEAVKSRTNNPPLFMYHGTDDRVVPIREARESCMKISEAGVNTEFQEFEGAAHELTPEELKLIYERINILVPEHIKQEF